MRNSLIFSSRSGFTLVELSIVLVILGLLAGGIFAGKGLMHSYEMRKILTTKEDYVSAVNLFSAKYGTLPGDYSHASEMWGKAARCGGASGKITATCDGDGDGTIQHPFLASEEPFMAWQHLQNAGLLGSSSDGVTYSGAPGPLLITDAVIGTNVPTGPNGKGGWQLWSVSTLPPTGLASDDYVFFAGKYGNIIMLGDDYAGVPAQPNVGGVLTPMEALQMDDKTDDGKPATGNLVVVTSAYEVVLGLPQCTKKADGSSPATALDFDAQYAIPENKDSVACPLVFRNAY